MPPSRAHPAVHLRPLLLLALSLHAAGGPAPPIPSEIFPLPVNVTYGSTPLALCSSFYLSCAAGSVCPAPLPAALVRYTSLLFFAGAPSAPGPACLPSLLIRVAGDAPLALGVDESYVLDVPAVGSLPAELSAATPWGALRGLESFLQLVVWPGPDAAPGTYAVTRAPVTVRDAPRFTVRGVLIDTSFNFLTVAAIKQTLDSMAVMKANILHWHALDDPAWPLVIEALPAFTAPGGGGPYAQVATYSLAEQADIAAYAWERGIMILVEFDLPGHSASWAAGGAELVIACPGHQTLINPVGEPGDGASIYAVLAVLMAELQGRLGTPGLPWVHLGGDEVSDSTCWDTSPAVRAWAARLNISADYTSVRRAFTARVQAVAAAAGLRASFWEEAFNGGFGVDRGAIVNPWVRTDVARLATAAGHDVVNYAGYYLDQWAPPAATSPEWYLANVSYAYVDSWRSLYAYDAERGVDPRAPGRVLGGVACAWGDNVDTAQGAVGLLYPRGLAVGEKLWSPAAATAVGDVQADDAQLDAVAARMEHARCRLVQRGVPAAPIGIAGDYGFCWSPAWGLPTPSAAPSAPPPPDDDASALLAAFAAAGVGTVLAALALPRGAPGEAAGAGASKGGGEGPAVGEGAPLAGAGRSPRSGGARVLALDQLRGATMLCMLFVNLYYGRSGLWPILSHGITYTSGPDLVEPAFHFCVGFALRLTLLRRLAATAGAGGWWGSRWAVLRPLLATRVVGLILLSMFFTEGWGQWDSWEEVGSLGDWLLALVRSRAPYHTLLHIAFVSVWTFLPMTLPWRARAGALAGSAALHALLHASFYFRWIAIFTLDEGGYFGFLGWSISALAGSLAHDALMHFREAEAAARGEEGAEAADRLPAPAPLAQEAAAPLLQAEGASPGGEGSKPRARPPAAPGARLSAAAAAAAACAAAGAGAMLLAYALSCLGTLPAGPLNPVCYNGTRVFFWGGFGDEVPCAGVPTLLGSRGLVLPPFMLPDEASNVVTMWTMTQRAGSVTYHLFTAGTSACLFALCLLACEAGAPQPSWWPACAPAAERLLGLRAQGGRLRMRWRIADVFGENALAVYLLADGLSDKISDMLPDDCPAWYFLIWGEGLYIGMAFVAADYLRRHKLFLRL